MKISQALAPAVVLVAFGVGLGAALLAQRAATAEPNAQQTVQIDSSSVSSICEEREVEMDEGYALTRKEKRRVCH
jgi:hypothetical protein